MIFLQKSSLSDLSGLALGTMAEIAASTAIWAPDLYSFTADSNASFRCIELCCRKKEYSRTINIAVQHHKKRKIKIVNGHYQLHIV